MDTNDRNKKAPKGNARARNGQGGWVHVANAVPAQLVRLAGLAANDGGWHSGHLLDFCIRQHLGEADLAAGECVHGFHALHGYTVLSPLRNGAHGHPEVIGQLFCSAWFSIEPFGEFHDASLGKPKLAVKYLLNSFLVGSDHG